MKKVFLMAVTSAALLFAQGAKAQTNLQVFYDFAPDRQHVTTTLEGFYNDNWGNTFFFLDHDYASKDLNGKTIAPSGTYLEIARCLNFWQDSSLAPLSFQVEYNGGVYNGYTINSAFLVGLDLFLHSADFNNTFNFKVLYKNIMATTSKVPMQFTFVWGLQDLFGVRGLRFSGFCDFWWEDHALFKDHNGALLGEMASTVFLSEPQLWYNLGQFFGCDNFNIGGEVELSYNFGTAKGFWARPCAGIKWVF
ncbi:MAG: DUF5020 family protein [Bacteroidales bacterium]|jgi:hypothetical protein|nr:DUF5020 family protein [Bacteroidales bacterium]